MDANRACSRMGRLAVQTAAALFVLIVAACSAAPAKTVTLATVGASGVSGTANLSDAGGGKTQVVVNVDANLNQDMPTLISPGTCASFDDSTVDTATLVILNDTRDGAGTTIIPVSLADLTTSPHILRVHANPDDHTPAACADIK